MLDPFINSRLGLWEIVALIGRGGMASVYEARNTENPSERRAIKVLHTALNSGPHAEEASARFSREFRLLSTLHHPNIARVYESGSLTGPHGEIQSWFAMELLEGTDLRALYEPGGVLLQDLSRSNRAETTDHQEGKVLDLPRELPRETRGQPDMVRARNILVQAARALEYLHLHGLVHRDVSPGNLILMPDGTLKLMDFGVVKDTGLSGDLTRVGEFLGTAAWVSPEQIQGRALDARADLYSLGSVLYLMLTGRRPFSSRTLAGVLEKHLHQPPRPPHELNPDVPLALENICLRLMEKDPVKRISSATHLLSLLESNPPQLLPLAGRRTELAYLGQQLIRPDPEKPNIILLTGDPGLGRTRLARLLVELANRQGVLALRTHAAGSDLPLGAFGRLFDALSAAGLPGPARLAEAFRGGSIDRHEVFSQYRQLILQAQVRVLVLDDLQALDASSWDLLQYLIRNTQGRAEKPVLWVLTASNQGIGAPSDKLKDDKIKDDKIKDLQSSFATTMLRLSPLTGDEVEELVISVAGNTPATIALSHRIHAESYGSPTFIAEMIHGLVKANVLIRPPTDAGMLQLVWKEAEVTRSPLPIPRTVRSALEARILGLSIHLRKLAEYLAVASQELSLRVLAMTETCANPDLLQQYLSELVASGIARERVGDREKLYRIAQSNLREILLEQLPQQTQRIIHQQLGKALELLYRQNPLVALESMAWHFEQAGAHGKAYAYLFRSGKRRLEQAFMADAAAFFGRAMVQESTARETLPLDEADRKLAELLLARATACEHLGRQTDAQADLERAWELALELQDARLQCRTLGELSQRARNAGDVDEAFEKAQQALLHADQLNEPGLRATPIQVLAGVAWGRGNLEEARKLWNELQSVGEAARDQRAMAFGQNGLGLAALCRGQTAEARRYFEQSATIFEALGLTGPLSTVRGNLVEIHHFSGNLKRGLELAERARELAKETMNPTGEARSLCYKALILGDLERGEESLATAETGLAQMRQLEDPSDELFARVIVCRAALGLGDRDKLREHLDACNELVAYDTEGFAPLLVTWRARLHPPDEAALLLVEAQRTPGARWAYQECRLDLALSRGYAEIGNYPEAVRHAEAAVRRADACGFRLYALKAHCLATLGPDPASTARHRRIAEGLARSLAASLSREDSDRFLASPWLTQATRPGT